MARSSSPQSRSVRAFLMLAAKSLAETGESWSVSRGTKTGRRPLSDANDESGYVYVELAEALALFAEIKGLRLKTQRASSGMKACSSQHSRGPGRRPV